MINLGGGVLKTGSNVLGFEVRIILKNLGFGRAAGQHVQNILDANAHTPNARAAAALARIGSYPIEYLSAHVRDSRDPEIARQYFVRLNLNPPIEKRRQPAAPFTVDDVYAELSPRPGR